MAGRQTATVLAFCVLAGAVSACSESDSTTEQCVSTRGATICARSDAGGHSVSITAAGLQPSSTLFVTRLDNDRNPSTPTEIPIGDDGASEGVMGYLSATGSSFNSEISGTATDGGAFSTFLSAD